MLKKAKNIKLNINDGKKRTKRKSPLNLNEETTKNKGKFQKSQKSQKWSLFTREDSVEQSLNNINIMRTLHIHEFKDDSN